MSHALPKVLLSVTSIPRRFDVALREVVSELQATGERVVVCLPGHYKKWGNAPLPDYLNDYRNVVLFQPSKDYGPATKLLGAIEYIHATNQEFDGIITFDDDVYYADPSAAVAYFKQKSLENPGCVITIGGMKLDQPPYRSKNGVHGNNTGYVDVVVGFRGVYYPVDKIARDSRIFDFASGMPQNIFNDDDAYFGICLSRMGIPVVAVKPPKKPGGRRSLRLLSTNGAGDSAVQEKADLHRVENEMQIFQLAVAEGWLPNPMAKNNPASAMRRQLNRWSLGRRLLRWQFNL